jgi:hypothetical protein
VFLLLFSRRWYYSPIALCVGMCIGLVLLWIAIVIVLSLIPVYLPRAGSNSILSDQTGQLILSRWYFLDLVIYQFNFLLADNEYAVLIWKWRCDFFLITISISYRKSIDYRLENIWPFYFVMWYLLQNIIVTVVLIFPLSRLEWFNTDGSILFDMTSSISSVSLSSLSNLFG